MTTDPADIPVRCDLCGDTLTGATIVPHLTGVHGQDMTPETWPDGGLVIHEPDAAPEDASC